MSTHRYWYIRTRDVEPTEYLSNSTPRSYDESQAVGKHARWSQEREDATRFGNRMYAQIAASMLRRAFEIRRVDDDGSEREVAFDSPLL